MIPLYQPSAEIHFLGNDIHPDATLHVEHLGIAAHQDDLEFMAIHGILLWRSYLYRW